MSKLSTDSMVLKLRLLAGSAGGCAITCSLSIPAMTLVFILKVMPACLMVMCLYSVNCLVSYKRDINSLMVFNSSSLYEMS